MGINAAQLSFLDHFNYLYSAKNIPLCSPIFEMEYKYNKKWEGVQQQQQDINKNVLWKLARQRYQLCFCFCRPCSQVLFEAKNSNFLVESEGGVRANFWMCHECAQRNMRLSDVHSQATAKKGEQKRRQRAAKDDEDEEDEEEEEERTVKSKPKKKRFARQFDQVEEGSEDEEEEEKIGKSRSSKKRSNW